jgi:hypothetical protein
MVIKTTYYGFMVHLECFGFNNVFMLMSTMVIKTRGGDLIEEDVEPTINLVSPYPQAPKPPRSSSQD